MASVNAEVVVSIVEPLAISIAVSCQAESSIGPVTPLIVAVAPLNATEPKLASVRTPLLDEGASTIHSADDRWALAWPDTW